MQQLFSKKSSQVYCVRLVVKLDDGDNSVQQQKVTERH